MTGKLLILLVFLGCTHTPSPSIVKTKYVRKDWRHWSDSDRDCQNTRNEILISRSLIPVTLDKRGCKVKKGKWDDYYYPQKHTLTSVIDIDHLVPLKHAHENGGAEWSQKKKEAFANDPENLVITHRKYNRKKGPKSIIDWLPVHEAYACKYINDWRKIKQKYRLNISQKEEDTIEAASCQ